MRILFTGGSSFTGYWFVKELAAEGHEVTAVFRKTPNEYLDDIRRARVERLVPICRPVYGCSFGDDNFLRLIGENKWDLFCAHGADVSNYNSPDFNVTAALESNTRRLPLVLDRLIASGCDKIIVTGSVFENDEGAGDSSRVAFSPYGLSKSFTWQTYRYHAALRAMRLGKFVIPNPFGPYEERRFTHYLMKNWFAGAVAAVNTPAYVRDNIHASLLAQAYGQFAGKLGNGVNHLNPSGYVETQGAFTERFAREMRSRLNLDCSFDLSRQTEFKEPRVRINIDTITTRSEWCESSAWDEIAAYYERMMRAQPKSFNG